MAGFGCSPRTLASAEQQRGIRFWDLHTNGLASTIEFRFDRAKELAWSPDGNYLAAVLSDNTICLYATATGKAIRVGGDPNEKISACTWSNDGKTIVYGHADGTIILSDIVSGNTIQTFNGHSDYVLGLSWSRNDDTIASSSKDRTVRLWSLSSKQAIILEGHTTPIHDVKFSADGRILASRSEDREIFFWRCDIARKIVSLKENDRRQSGGSATLDFNPSESVVAIPSESSGTVHIWEFNPTIVLNLASSDPTFRYTNAKVVLVGNSGVGKSGLGLVLTGQPFAATESTHGRRVWIFDTSEVEADGGLKETRETLLWDLAGQPGYRLIHQLHLHEVAVALVVFDLRSETDPFSGVRHWERALRQANQIQRGELQIKKFLVAARSDRGGVGVSKGRVETLKRDLHFDEYFETSAKEGWTIGDLADAIKTAINWNALPKVVSTGLFQRIKSFLIDEKQANRLLSSIADLYVTFLRLNDDLIDEPQLFEDLPKNWTGE